VKIAVSGSSGFIGSALAPDLEAAGHEVVLLVRRPPSSPREIEWDPASGRLDPEALAGVDAVVNLNGANIGRRWTRARKAQIMSSRVDSTRLLSAAIARLADPPRVLVCAGGVGVYGDRGDEILTEESETGEGFLAAVGTAWEAAAEPARAAGIRVVNFRHGLALDRSGGALGQLLTPFKLGLGGRIGSGKQWWSWVALDDLLAAYGFVLERDLEGPLNLLTSNPTTNAQFTKALGKALGRPAVLPFPTIAAKIVFGEMAEQALLASQRALPARLLDAGFTFEYSELDAALDRALER
jgi:uncharacterized protein (TIGR01777 family)